ncbi:unnamed protein product [Rhizoctonia solani]|uniref:Uncharacterized protein n=1 Tax=Rhizoctonia solani TaxID=456999 RepID=A0A8H3DHG1_9AGAM|nr:unnamed protein product [Rhizoctonia solani]CAE6531102.1 unnamed protein product [Rhizoctonia solani]
MARITAQVVQAPPAKPSARGALCWPLQWFRSITPPLIEFALLAGVPANTAFPSVNNGGRSRLRVLEGLHQEGAATGIE